MFDSSQTRGFSKERALRLGRCATSGELGVGLHVLDSPDAFVLHELDCPDVFVLQVMSEALLITLD